MCQSNIEWELKWIDEHLDRYDSIGHAESVKRNIEKRYKILELEAHIKQLEKENVPPITI